MKTTKINWKTHINCAKMKGMNKWERYPVNMKDFEAKTSPKKKMDTESWFIECYRKNQGHPLRTLMHLYKGNYHKFVMAVICFFAKHACVWAHHHGEYY